MQHTDMAGGKKDMHTQVKWKVLQNIFSSEKSRNRERERERRDADITESKRESQTKHCSNDGSWRKKLKDNRWREVMQGQRRRNTAAKKNETSSSTLSLRFLLLLSLDKTTNE